MKKIVAAFDFDGTVTYHDSLFPFLLFCAGPLKTFFRLLLDSPWLIGFVFGSSSRQGTKEKILKQFFQDMPIEKMQNFADQYAEKVLPKQIRPEALEKIRWHLDQGHHCVIVSASMDLYIKPWAAAVGIHEVIGSKLEILDGKVTGKLIGSNCWGPEKVRRLTHALGDLENFTLYAYGDSRGDQELLAIADHPFYRTF